MPVLNIQQVVFESGTWKRLLRFMIDENVHLKNRLSEILKTQFDKKLLDELEIFYSRFIKQDDYNNLLRNEMAEFDKLLRKGEPQEEQIKIDLYKKFNNLHSSIINAEGDFGKLQVDFNNFLQSSLQSSPPGCFEIFH